MNVTTIKTSAALSWVGDVPTGWKVDRLKDLASISTGTTPPKSDPDNYTEGGVPWIKPDGLRGDVVSESKETLSEKGVSLSRLVPKGSILVGCIGDIGNIAIAGCGLCTNQQINSITFDAVKVDQEFAKYAVEITEGEHWRLSTLVVVSIVKKSKQGTIEIPLPPIREQKRIATYLDASCTAIDRAVETKQKQLDTLDTLRKSIITPAILSGITPNRQFQKIDNPWLDQIPEGWKIVSLKRVSETQGGITLGKTHEGSLVERPYLRAANVQDGYLDLDKITKIKLPEDLVSRYELRAGDVLMTEGGDLDKLGRGFLWEGQIAGCLHQNHVFAIRTVQRLLLPEFLTYLTTSRFGRDYFEATGKRTTNLASTNSTKVGLLPVPLPKIEEQREIVNYLDNKLKQTKAIEETICSQITTLTAYRKSLIHECVTGKRSIIDADVAKVEAHA